jgi:hypothetical protein
MSNKKKWVFGILLFVAVLLIVRSSCKNKQDDKLKEKFYGGHYRGGSGWYGGRYSGYGGYYPYYNWYTPWTYLYYPIDYFYSIW